MRPEPDLPRRPRRRRRAERGERRSRFAGRGRVVIVAVLVVLFVLLVSLRGVAAFYTDYLWFQSVHLGSVWGTILGTKAALTAFGGVIFFVVCWANLRIAERLAPVFRPSSGENDFIERYHEFVGERAWMVRFGVSGFLALVVGLSLGSSWNEWILFTHRVDFGIKDATFHTDAGFYVFQLPFLSTAAGWLFSSLVLIVFVSVLAHIVNGGIRFNTQLDRVTPQVKAHISVLLGLLALVQTGRYWLDRYQLTFSTRGTVDGATYTDVNVELRSIYLLMLIALFAFGLFIANIWRRGWVLPGMAVGLWILVAVVAGAIVPAFVQRFRVQPAESSMEHKYIVQNIEATRYAYGLEHVDDRSFAFDGKLKAADLRADADTVRNIRLWDASAMKDVFQRQQQIKSFYTFDDVDVDRYKVDGQERQVLLGVRNLNEGNLPNASWQSTHLAYTHGYGIAAATANRKIANGGPAMVAQDIPVKSPSFPTSDPAIYFGENKPGYVIVDTGRSEVDYQKKDNTTAYTRYRGKDGIKIGSGLTGFVRKAAFALRFGDINPLISGDIHSSSKVLIQRDVTARLKMEAPFLAWDHDPYVVIVDGRTKYIVDGYTTTRNFPNAERADTGGLQPGSGLSGRSFDYARNSVKAVVDAYDGTVTMYVVDHKDPIIRAYVSAFPKLFTLTKAPDDLVAHFRYPEDLFTVQTQMWARYHVTDADTFYNGNNRWSIDRESGSVGLKATKTSSGAATAGVGPDGQTLTSSDRFEPQYLLLRLPGDTTDSFVLMRPFVPASSGASDAQGLLSGFMSANSDPDHYGELRTYVIPPGNPPDGPYLVGGKMLANSQVSTTQTLLCQQGSKCTLRNVVMVPIGRSLLYVRSLFVQASTGGVPSLQRVIVSYQQDQDNSNVAVDCSLKGALKSLFGTNDLPSGIEDVSVQTGTSGANGSSTCTSTEGGSSNDNGGSGNGSTTTTTTPDTGGGTGTFEHQENVLIAKIVAAFDDADAALAKSDLTTYAKDIAKAKELTQQLVALRAKAAKDGGTGSGSGSGNGSTTTTTTTAPKGSSSGGTTTTTAPKSTTTVPKSTTTTTSAGA